MPFLVDLIRRIIPRSARNALRRPRVTLERTLAKLSYAFGQTATVKLADGCVVTCHPMCSDEFRVFTTQPEQINEMRSFVRLASPGMKMMDIGAHWGALTLAALHFGRKNARVLAIEASKEAARILNLNIRLNNAADRVILVNAACGDRAGEIPMLTTGAGGADYFVVPANARPDTVLVKQVSADGIREEHSFNPTHLKIDVEGYEEEVLTGAERILHELKPIVLLELHGDLIRRRNKKPDRVLELLQDAGYSRWQSVEGDVLTCADLAVRGYNARFVALPPP